MDKKARAVLGLTAALLSCVLAWAWMQRPPEPQRVRVSKSFSQDIYNSISVPGTVEAEASAAVASGITGEVAALCVQVGDTVREGDALFTVAPSEESNAPAISAAGLEQAVQVLAGADQGRTAVSGADGVVRASCAGTVLSLPAEGQTVYQGLPAARIADLSSLCVRAKVPETYVQQLSLSQNANVTATAAGDRVYAATVGSIAPVATRAVSLTGESGTAEVEALLSLNGNLDGLRPGYSVTAKIFTDYHPAAVVVPYEAVFQQGEQEYVFTIENGRARRTAIKTGYLLEQATEVIEGLEASCAVILSPPETLGDGDAVEAAA